MKQVIVLAASLASGAGTLSALDLPAAAEAPMPSGVYSSSFEFTQ